MKIDKDYVVTTIERPYKERLASVRDYEVEEARKRGLPLRIELKDTIEFMIVPVNKLDQGTVGLVEYESNYNQGVKYKLVDYAWIPTTPEKEIKKARRIELMGEEWYELLKNEFDKDYMKSLNSFISSRRTVASVYPETSELFNAFKYTPFDKVKVVIIGQDPYHTPHSKDPSRGIAHGLAFSSIDPATCPPSLKIIFEEIEEDIKFGLYLKEDWNLKYWADQGVLLLNTILTSEKGKALQHENKGWEEFTDAVVRTLNRHPKKLVWLLWGNKAKAYRERRLIDAGFHTILEAAHPAAEAYAAKEGRIAGFYGCKHFSKTNDILKKWGHGEINW